MQNILLIITKIKINKFFKILVKIYFYFICYMFILIINCGQIVKHEVQ